MKIMSTAVDNGYLKAEYGINTPEKDRVLYGIPQRSFPICWSDVPQNTKSFALVCIDYDNVEDEGVTWIHWLVSDIAGECRGMDDDEAVKGNLVQGRTSWALPYGPYEEIPDSIIASYGGPAPDRTHEYEIEIFALDIIPNLENGFYYNKLRKIINEHTIEKAILKFYYKGAE